MCLRGTSNFFEIINGRHSIKPVLSHLSLGEAFGNCFLKGKEKAGAFIGLIEKLRDYISIIENDGIDNQFEEVKNQVPALSALSITDAIHVATALKNGCSVLRTFDRDLYGIAKCKVRNLGNKFDIPEFSISKMNSEK